MKGMIINRLATSAAQNNIYQIINGVVYAIRQPSTYILVWRYIFDYTTVRSL